jgi:hypothetical protein
MITVTRCHYVTWLVVLALSMAVGQTTRAAPPTSQPAAKFEPKSLFDGESLKNWKVVDFAGAGEVRVDQGAITMTAGERLTGVVWTGDKLPTQNYTITLLARRVDGSDFFCGLTFPVDDSFATLVLGGWGGALCGISSFDDEDAAHNETKSFQRFDTGKWYEVRLRVSPGRIQAWIDDRPIVNVLTKGKKIGLRGEMDPSKPLGIAAYQTRAEIKDIKIKPYPEK